jgi:hypothetical protein
MNHFCSFIPFHGLKSWFRWSRIVKERCKIAVCHKSQKTEALSFSIRGEMITKEGAP